MSSLSRPTGSATGPTDAVSLAEQLCGLVGVEGPVGVLRREGVGVGERLSITGVEPVLAARYPLATRAAAVLGATGIVAARLWERRGGRAQDVSVDLRHAGALMRGFYDQEVDGEALPTAPTDALPLARAYRSADGRWVQLYAVMEPARSGVLGLLGLGDDDGSADALAHAIGACDAFALEDRAAELGLPVTVVRSPREWAQTGAARALAPRPLVSVRQVGDAPVWEPPPGIQPLSGVRVLDLCRIVAGPVCGRTLGEQGADVLAALGEDLGWIRRAMIDTAPGKRNATLSGDVCGTLRELAARVHVFCQGARPGRMAARGLGVDELVAARPGLVYVSLDGWGPDGPWADRPGFEALAQAATGWTWEHMDDDDDDDDGGGGGGAPRSLAALAGDHLTGYLAALGVLAALERRMRVGGSWHVSVSLARTVEWLREDGPVFGPDAGAGADWSVSATRDLRVELVGGFGRVAQLRPAPAMSVTPPRWRFGAHPPGSHAAGF